jgi:hypothetical protein
MKNLSLQETVGYHDALVGMVWSWYGKYDLMTKRYAESVSKDPSWSAIANSLGWFYATAPGGLSDGELAVKYARIAINAFSNADTLDTLACAYARKGEFESASATAVEAGRSDYQRWGGLSPEHKKAIDARVPCVDPKFNPRGKGDSQPFRPHDAYRSPHQRRNPSAVF